MLRFTRKRDALHTEFFSVGLHLLLSPVGTVAKPAYPSFAHRDSGGEVAMLSAESQVDVTHGLWKNIGVTSVLLFSMKSLVS